MNVAVSFSPASIVTAAAELSGRKIKAPPQRQHSIATIAVTMMMDCGFGTMEGGRSLTCIQAHS